MHAVCGGDEAFDQLSWGAPDQRAPAVRPHHKFERLASDPQPPLGLCNPAAFVVAAAEQACLPAHKQQHPCPCLCGACSAQLDCSQPGPSWPALLQACGQHPAATHVPVQPMPGRPQPGTAVTGARPRPPHDTEQITLTQNQTSPRVHDPGAGLQVRKSHQGAQEAQEGPGLSAGVEAQAHGCG